MTTPTFRDLGVSDDLVASLASREVTEPFPIQAAAIPDGLAGRDLCGRAKTGSGKTLAFGIPVVMRVERAQPRRPRALILGPTRELVSQIRDELAPLASRRGRRVAAIYGGVGYGKQKEALRRGVDILAACPGRLEDLIGQNEVSLADVDIVVLDEADRMADMGFLPAVRRILKQCRRERQTLLFSATLDGDVAVLTRDFQRDPARHEVGPAEPNIREMTHLFWQLERPEKADCAAEVVRAAGPTIVFCRTRHGSDRLARKLNKAGVQAAAIHGRRSQNQRERALEAFSEGRVQALVATDVAARGIHVDDVACVLLHDPSVDDKTYVHRSGRTARAGAAGVVVSFVEGEQIKDVRNMARRLDLRADLTAPDPSAIAGMQHTTPTTKATTNGRASANGASKGDGGSRSGGGQKSASGGGQGSGSGGGSRSGAGRRRRGRGRRRGPSRGASQGNRAAAQRG